MRYVSHHGFTLLTYWAHFTLRFASINITNKLNNYFATITELGKISKKIKLVPISRQLNANGYILTIHNYILAEINRKINQLLANFTKFTYTGFQINNVKQFFNISRPRFSKNKGGPSKADQSKVKG